MTDGISSMTASNKSGVFRGRAALTARLITVLSLLALCASGAEGGTYCAFEVHVSKPSGAPFAGVPVVLVSKGSEISKETRTDLQGNVKLCDAPLDPVDVVIGFDSCGSVTIRKVQPDWLETKQVWATYERSYCPELILPRACHVVVRVKDGDGKPVAGARLAELTGYTGRHAYLSDNFGRIFLLVPQGEVVRGWVAKKDEGRVPVSTLCNLDSEPNVDISVALHR